MASIWNVLALDINLEDIKRLMYQLTKFSYMVTFPAVCHVHILKYIIDCCWFSIKGMM